MITYSSWDLQIMREAKAVRDAEGTVIEYLDEILARAEAQHAAGRVALPTDQGYDEVPFRGDPGCRTGAPARRMTSSNEPSEKQVAFLDRLCAERGVDRATVRPVDRRMASTLIDALMGWKSGPMPATLVRHGSKAAAMAAPARPAGRPASERQVEFVTDLLGNRDLEGAGVERPTVDPTEMTSNEASQWIERLLPLRRIRRSAVPEHGIRTGRYAYQPAEGHAQFYVVDTRGKIWVQAGPARHPYNGQLNEALLAIKADPKVGAALYGQLLGRCGRCGLELTDEESRALGLGPICAGKSEW